MMRFVIAAAIACATFPGITALAQSVPDERADKGASQPKKRSVVEAAQAFIDSLTQPQRAEVFRPYSFSSASHWSNLPEQDMAHGRIGLSTGTLTSAQWQTLNKLLAAATGSRENGGYDEIRAILNADDFIRRSGGRIGAYGRDQYRIAFLGEPQSTGKWQLQFGGHHLAINNTYVDGILVGATPSFRGAEPTSFESDGVLIQPLTRKLTSIRALLASFDGFQVKLARLHRSPGDLVAGPGHDWDFPEQAKGIQAVSLTIDQRRLLWSVIEEYVRDVDDLTAAKIMATYERELDDTFISFFGDASLDQTDDYFRIDGPSVWIELLMDGPWSFSLPHPHSVWRDKSSDYGGTRT